MPANIPDTGAINSLGGQFNTNVFEHAQKHLSERSSKLKAQHISNVKTTQANKQRFAQSAAQGVKQGQANFARKQKAQQTQANQAAKAQAAGVKSGRVAPAAGAPPRTFAMKPTAQAKQAQAAGVKQATTMQQQRNFAHGEALKFQQAQFKTQQSQKNYAHGQAIQEANKRSKGGPMTTTTAPKVPSLTPGFSSPVATHTPIKAQKIAPTTFSHQFAPQKAQGSPTGPATASFSSPEGKSVMPASPAPQKPVVGPQFSDVSTKSNSPFPTHQHPTGSSNQTLPSLTANQPRTNEFTVGSRNVQSGGIATKGSQLEAWAQTKSKAVQARRKSAAAGGRDKGLASTAKAWESAANQPLHKFSE
jgi:hypothetical protein